MRPPTSALGELSTAAPGHGHQRRFEPSADSLAVQRLRLAFEPLQSFPALVHARDRTVRSLTGGALDIGELVSSIESDPALALAVVTAACRQPGARAGVATVPAATEALSSAELRVVLAQVPVFDFFQRSHDHSVFVERFRLHALATQNAADRIHAATGIGDLDRLRLAALLHDIGKFVLMRRHDRYGDFLQLPASPEQRVALELRQLGMDHPLAGGVLLRTLGLPLWLATLIERHHADGVHGEAAVIRVADMLAHYAVGDAIDQAAFASAGAALGLSTVDLRALLARLPQLGPSTQRRERSPLTTRQLQMVRMLGEGKPYKQIGDELAISPSTVRSHLHQVYKRLGVPDRAQAVLLATRRGWIE